MLAQQIIAGMKLGGKYMIERQKKIKGLQSKLTGILVEEYANFYVFQIGRKYNECEDYSVKAVS